MKKEVNRSPLFYVGDKYKLISEIKTYFPQCINRFIEPFVGGGSVFLNIDAEEFLLNDIDTNVIDIHKFLCSYSKKPNVFFEKLFTLIQSYGLSCSYKEDVIPVSLKKEFVKTYIAKYNKDKYIQLRSDYNDSDRTDMLKLYALLIYGFNHMIRFNGKNDFNLPVGNVDFNQNAYNALVRYFSLTQAKKPKWKSMDFRRFLSRITWRDGDFVYLDPPYLITFSEYNKLWDEDTEQSLLALLDKMSGKGIKFAISNVTHYKGRTNELFLEWAKKYNTHSIKSNYISFHDNTIKSFNEVLITNY